MCGICASSDLNKFKELVRQNASRGNFSHSFTVFDFKEKIIKQQIKSFIQTELESDLNKLMINENYYYISHTQAPTGSLVQDFEKIHPSIQTNGIYSSYLWHNGILTDKFMEEHYHGGLWDTNILHQYTRLDKISGIEGSFACIYLDDFKDLFCFRNPQAPLYMLNDTISSIQFEKSMMIESGVYYQLIKQNDNLYFDKIDNKRFICFNIYEID